jgi:hypothetical protein
MNEPSGVSLRIAVDCQTLEQVLALLACTKGLGLTPQIGMGEPIARERAPRKKESAPKKKKRPSRAEISGNPPKPKRYPPSMQVRLIQPPGKDAPPKLRESYKKLHKKFGEAPFRKSEARPHLNGSSTYLTKLLDEAYAAPLST